MMTGRPIPPPNPLTVGFWDAARRHELVIQRCTCGKWRHYPGPLCPHCYSNQWDWESVGGRGKIYSFTVTHRPFHPAWAERGPYAIATVELDEGVRMVSDLPSEDTEKVSIGAAVEVFFDDQESVTYPRFRLV